MKVFVAQTFGSGSPGGWIKIFFYKTCRYLPYLLTKKMMKQFAVGKSTYSNHNVWSYDGRGGH